MQKLTITLAIPAYNEEKYIEECLTYAIKNSKGNLKEILVIDNGSTDKTAHLAKRFSGVRVVNELQKGMVRARQKAYQEVTSDILAFIDADTRMPEGWVETIITEFESNPKLATLSGPYIYHDVPTLQKILVRIYWICAWPMYKIIGYMVVGGNFAIRKSVLDQMTGFDTNIEFYGEDTDIARRASKFGQSAFKLSFVMYTSARRLKGQGMLSTTYHYVTNFFSQVVRHKPITTAYKDIR